MASKNLTIYGDLMSQPSRAVISFCQITGIDFKLNVIAPLEGAQFTPEFKKINPLKQVPVLVENNAS